MVSSLFDRISTCRIARPSLDARSGTNVVGLIHHFYQVEVGKRNGITFVCQCPLGLIPHFYGDIMLKSLMSELMCVNALSGLYLISTKKSIVLRSSRYHNVSMPSRAYTSFLRYPFKNLGFMQFPEPVFAGIYQNILTAAVFRAC